MDVRALFALVTIAASALVGCASVQRGPDPVDARHRARVSELQARAWQERAEELERTIADLREDLAEAGQTLIEIESGLRGGSTRADAVSAQAEARILVERAARAAPWRGTEIDACRERLEEADRQLEAGRFGAAIFFASRAQRAGSRVLDEARRLRGRRDLLYVLGSHVNLRADPTTGARIIDRLTRGTPVITAGHDSGWIRVRTLEGHIGWMHASLLGPLEDPT